MKRIVRMLLASFCLSALLTFAVLAFDTEEVPEVTIPEAHRIAMDADGKQYIVQGTIKEIRDTMAGNLYIEDEEGHTLYICGLYSADGSVGYDAMEVKPLVGDDVVLQGQLCTYNGEAQMKNARLKSHKSTQKEEKPEPAPEAVVVTIPEANAIGMSKGHDTYTEQMYIVTGVVCQIVSDSDGDLYIRDADGNRLHVRGILSSDGTAYDAMFPQPDLGDTITLVGVLGQYHGDPKMKNATILIYNPEGPAPTVDAMVLALCSLLASAGMLAILPKKWEG